VTPCLRPDQIVDVIDGAADRAVAAHLDACGHCRAALAEVREALAAAAGVEVPEPSPFFWPQINARVRSAIDDEARSQAATGWRAWLRWDVVVPLAGLATLVVALTSTIDRAPSTTPAPPAETRVAPGDPGLAAGEAAPGDSALELMLDLMATLPDGDWTTLGVSRLPELGVAAQSLSAEEQQALSAILQAAVERPQS
jgi:hypothetical protein